MSVTHSNHQHQLGPRILAIREELGMSRPELAATLNVPTTTLKNWECGYRDVPGWFVLALVHHTETGRYTDYLLGLAPVEQIA